MSQRSVVQLVKHQVIHLAPSASVREAAQLMSENHIGALLIMDEGRLAGIFTERDGPQPRPGRGTRPGQHAAIGGHDPRSGDVGSTERGDAGSAPDG